MMFHLFGHLNGTEPLLVHRSCTPTYPTNTIIKFADNMAVVGLFSKSEITLHR